MGAAEVLHAFVWYGVTSGLRADAHEAALLTDGQDFKLAWLLGGRCHPGELKRKVRFGGRVLGRLALASGAAPCDHGVDREPEPPGESEEAAEGESGE